MREYGMDLPYELQKRRLSWRRFCVLLAGLSAHSRWQQALAGDAAGPVTLNGAAAAAYLNAMAGGG